MSRHEQAGAEERSKIWYLKNTTDMFSDLDEDEMNRLGELFYTEEFEKNESVYFPGDAAQSIYFVKYGRIKINRLLANGKQVTMAVLRDGELFGEQSITGEDERKALVKTMEKSLVCRAEREPFLTFIRDHPSMAFRITKLFGDRRKKVEMKIENLLLKKGRPRLAYTLLTLFDRHSIQREDGTPVLEFTQTDLADLSGLTRPTTTTFLNEMQEDGLIELSPGNVVLKDRDGLEKMASR